MTISESLLVEALAACMPPRLHVDHVPADAISVEERSERRDGDRVEVTAQCDFHVEDGFSMTVVLSFDAHAPTLDDARVVRVDD